MAKKINHKQEAGITRRAFARKAALAAATVAALPTVLTDDAFSQQVKPAPAAPPPAAEPNAPPQLSAASQAEVEARVAGVMRQFGGRLSEAEKTEVRRLLTLGQRSVEDLRAYPLEISDEPATILRIRRGGKR